MRWKIFFALLLMALVFQTSAKAAVVVSKVEMIGVNITGHAPAQIPETKPSKFDLAFGFGRSNQPHVASLHGNAFNLGVFAPGVFDMFAEIDPKTLAVLRVGASTIYAYAGTFQIENVQFDPAVATVPEPSTWAMMFLGFAGVGFMAYRRSRKDQSLVLAA